MPENSRPQDQNYQVSQELRGKYLTFVLADEEYAISILKVREIIGLVAVTPMPAAPDYVCGVINLRDEVIPVVDLRTRLGLGGHQARTQQCIIIVEAAKPDLLKCWEVKQCGREDCPAYGHHDRRCWYLTGTHCGGQIQGSFYQKKAGCQQCGVYRHAVNEGTVVLVGLVVDGVTEVLQVSSEQIDPPPAMTMLTDNAFVLGLVKDGQGLKIILDIDQMLAPEDGEAVLRVA